MNFSIGNKCDNMNWVTDMKISQNQWATQQYTHTHTHKIRATSNETNIQFIKTCRGQMFPKWITNQSNTSCLNDLNGSCSLQAYVQNDTSSKLVDGFVSDVHCNEYQLFMVILIYHAESHVHIRTHINGQSHFKLTWFPFAVRIVCDSW